MSTNNIVLVDNETSLNILNTFLSSLGEDKNVSVDTEFTRTKTYYPILDLVQICIDDTVYIVDPHALKRSSFFKAFVNTKANCLFFSAREDLEILSFEAHKLGLEKTLPEKCIDLQLMMAFLGLGYSKGLQATLEEELNVILPKDQTRSDWSLRPLTDEQIVYAANDVLYLDKLYQSLISKFKHADPRLTWFYEEMDNLKDNCTIIPEPETAYLNAKGAGTVSLAELTVFKFLCQKRMEFAMENDVAQNRIITGCALSPIARLKNLSNASLAKAGVKPGAIRQYGKLVISWFNEAQKVPVEQDLEYPIEHILSYRNVGKAVKKLKHVLSLIAKERGINEELISSKQLCYDYFKALKENSRPRLFTSWYQECIGKEHQLPPFPEE